MQQTAGNRPLPTSLGLATSLVEGGALMWDSPSVVAGEEGRSSPVPNDLRGRRPHHSGAGLLRPVIPATCATVSLTTDTVAPEKTPSDSESISDNTDVRFPPCRLPLRPTRFVLPTSRKPSLLGAGGSASENADSLQANLCTVFRLSFGFCSASLRTDIVGVGTVGGDYQFNEPRVPTGPSTSHVAKRLADSREHCGWSPPETITELLYLWATGCW